MMIKGIGFFKKKWLILGLIFALIPLYQNMTPFEAGQEVDIRDYAPRRPAGYLENPMAAYVPQSFSGDSMNDVQESLLGHNFNEMLKRTEDIGASLVDNSDSYTGEPQSARGVSETRSDERDKLKLDVLSPSSLRLSYKIGSRHPAGEWTMACENKGNSLKLQMTHPLSTTVDLGLSHETEAKTSQVRMGISW